MIEKIIKISCDYCHGYQESSLKGTGIKNMVKKAERWGWKTLLIAGKGIYHFCDEECLEDFKKLPK